MKDGQGRQECVAHKHGNGDGDGMKTHGRTQCRSRSVKVVATRSEGASCVVHLARNCESSARNPTMLSPSNLTVANNLQ
jgi:hypothetical protein